MDAEFEADVKDAGEFLDGIRQMPKYTYHGTGVDATINGRVVLGNLISNVLGFEGQSPRIINEVMEAHGGKVEISENSSTCSNTNENRYVFTSFLFLLVLLIYKELIILLFLTK